MGDALLLDRLNDALSAPPPALPPSMPDEDENVVQLIAKGNMIIKKSRKWVVSLTNAVARARRNPDHKMRAGEMWADLEASFDKAIADRKRLFDISQDFTPVIDRISSEEGRRLAKIHGKVREQLGQEHDALVRLYYLLKAEADNLADDTQSGQESLNSPEDIEAYFRRIRAS